MKSLSLFQGAFLLHFWAFRLTKSDLTEVVDLQDFVNAPENSDTTEFNKDTLVSRLSNQRTLSLNCVKAAGVNPEGFASCCGQNYDKVSAGFFQIYKSVERYLMGGFNHTVMSACWLTDQTGPCSELARFAQTAVEDSENKFQAIADKADQVKDMAGVDEHLIDRALGDFKSRNPIFLQSRSLIASYLLDTIHDIAEYIQNSGVPANFDFRTYNPLKQLDDLGVVDSSDYKYDPDYPRRKSVIFSASDNLNANLPADSFAAQIKNTLAQTQEPAKKKRGLLSRVKGRKAQASQDGPVTIDVLRPVNTDSLSVDEKLKVIEQKVEQKTNPFEQNPDQALDGQQPSFNKGLLQEVEARELVNYYIARGMVDKSKLDMTLMPSEILDQIQSKKLVIDPIK